MVRVDVYNLKDVLVSGRPAGVMFNKDGSVIWEKVDDKIALYGNRDLNTHLETVVPKWCNYIEYILVAGGGGGESGSGSDGQDGRPADGGEVSAGSYIIPHHLDRDTHDFRIKAMAGVGGHGGTSGGGSGRHGTMGGNSNIYVYHGDLTNPYETTLYSHRVDGGLGGPASNRPRSGTSGGRPVVAAPRYLHMTAQAGVGENYQPQPTWWGVGGGGGSGGIFNRYTPGGAGAPGCVLIAFGGSPVHPWLSWGD